VAPIGVMELMKAFLLRAWQEEIKKNFQFLSSRNFAGVICA
jgi:hypothetical protein